MGTAVFADQVRGTKTGRSNLHEEAARVEASRLVLVYEAHEFSVSSPTLGTSIRSVVNHAAACTCARATGAFGRIDRAQRVSIRNMADPESAPTALVVVRYNAADADPFTIGAGEYHDFNTVEVSDIFITNESGIAVSLRVLMG